MVNVYISGKNIRQKLKKTEQNTRRRIVKKYMEIRLLICSKAGIVDTISKLLTFKNNIFQ